MLRLLCFFAMLAFCGGLAAQPVVRTVSEGPDGIRTTFILEGKQQPGTLTLFFTLYDVYNVSGATNGTKVYEIAHNGVRFLTLRASDESYGPGYRYSYWSYGCRINPPVDTAFVYRMPCAVGRPVRVLHTVHILDKYSKSREEQRELGVMFPLEKGDTVFAMRRGVVTKISRPRNPIPADISYTTESVSVTVEQPDGSYAWYICFDPEGVFVEAGDEVLPGTPIGRVGTYDGEHHNLSVQLFRYVSEARPSSDPNQYEVETLHFKPRFATSEGVVTPVPGRVYTPVTDDALVTREMSKRELRQWKAAHEGRR